MNPDTDNAPSSSQDAREVPDGKIAARRGRDARKGKRTAVSRPQRQTHDEEE